MENKKPSEKELELLYGLINTIYDDLTEEQKKEIEEALKIIENDNNSSNT